MKRCVPAGGFQCPRQDPGPDKGRVTFMRFTITAVFCLVFAASALAEGLAVSPMDTTGSVVAAQKGKRITVRLRSGQELSGVVRDASERLLVLGEVSGREFFDAVVPLDAIEAVLVRTRQQ